jgi:hypothetical protein
MRKIVLGDNYHTAGILVEPVNYSRSHHASDPLKIHTVVQKSVHQRPRLPAGQRVYDNPRIFVHYYDISIFEDYFQRQIFRLYRHRFGPVGKFKGYRFA